MACVGNRTDSILSQRTQPNSQSQPTIHVTSMTNRGKTASAVYLFFYVFVKFCRYVIIMSARKELDENLIIQVENFPCLYNITLKEYKDVKAKDNAWAVVSAAIGSSGMYSIHW